MRADFIKKAVSVMLFFMAIVAVFSVKAQAKSSGYIQLFTGYNEEEIVGSGDYSFQKKGEEVYIKAPGESDWTKTPLNGYEGAFSNGREAYFMSDNELSKYIFSDKSVEVLKEVPKVKEDSAYSVSAMSGDFIFILRSSFDAWENRTFSYNIGTKKLKNEFAGEISSISGNYVVGIMGYKTDISPSVFNLYKLTSTGLKKKKRLTKSALSVRVIKKKLYYLQYKDYKMDRGTLYCCSLSGSGKKKLGTFKDKDGSMIYMVKVTSKKCVLNIGGKKYVYTYKTKKLKRKE